MDRLPPFAEESERAIIGCCLTSPVACIAEAQVIIKSEDYFYDLRNQMLWQAIVAMPSATVNLISIFQKLKDLKQDESVGGVAYLNQCQDEVVSTANLSVWLGEVQDRYVLRRLLASFTELTSKVYSCGDKVAELLDESEKEILAIRPTKANATDIKSLVNQAIDKMEYRCANPGKLTGLSTGLIDLDTLTDGVHIGESIVIAGFPSTGKTALAVNIATFNALLDIPVAIFTAEMTAVQIAIRQICATARANFKRLVESDAPKLVSAAGRISHSPMHIQTANGLTAGQVMAMARRLKQKHNIQLIVVDYIQLLTGTGDNREQQISSISKAMKSMAIELDCTVLALSQLTDDGKLRESRSIGQDADSVWKLANEGEWHPHVQAIKLSVEKCRDGETGFVPLTFFKQFTKFESVARIANEDIPPHYQPDSL